MRVLLPATAAMDELEELVGERRLARQVYDYWAAKRAAEGGPLLSQLWFEEPWRVSKGRQGCSRGAEVGRGAGGALGCSCKAWAVRQLGVAVGCCVLVRLELLLASPTRTWFIRTSLSAGAAACAAQSVAWVDEEGEEEDAPFAGGSPRGQRGGGKRRRIDEDDAVDALQRLRGDLEVGTWGVVHGVMG
jgi:hypothetical protein